MSVPLSVLLINRVARHNLARNHLEAATTLAEILYYQKTGCWFTVEPFNCFQYFPRHIEAYAFVKLCPFRCVFEPLDEYMGQDLLLLESFTKRLDPFIEQAVALTDKPIPICPEWWDYCIGKPEEEIASRSKVLIWGEYVTRN